jgi:hypothetical protein
MSGKLTNNQTGMELLQGIIAGDFKVEKAENLEHFQNENRKSRFQKRLIKKQFR